MTRGQRARELFVPWAGLAGAVLGAGFAHQAGSDSVFNDCFDSAPIGVWIVCIIGLLVALAGAWLSWPVFRDGEKGATRRTIALISLLTVALFAMAIVLPMIASLMIPRCFA